MAESTKSTVLAKEEIEKLTSLQQQQNDLIFNLGQIGSDNTSEVDQGKSGWFGDSYNNESDVLQIGANNSSTVSQQRG